MKLKKTLEKSGIIFRDVMVVVVGIAITFSLNNWMNNKKERKDVQHYLNALKMELEENLNNVEDRTRYHKEAMELCEYLNSHKPEAYQRDSIDKYEWIINGTYPFSYKTSAFEMLKMSGAMRLMKDKELLSTIWNTYQQLEFLKTANDSYMLRKGDEMYLFWQNRDEVMDLFNHNDFTKVFRSPTVKRYFSFLKISTNRATYQQFLEGAEQIRSTIEAIDNQKSF